MTRGTAAHVASRSSDEGTPRPLPSVVRVSVVGRLAPLSLNIA
ncbi:hypothetical protein PC123_g27214 [Phytophthora cactorum]|nr:hypothetical protein PC123_g27214 [Phytophthora cactorum]